MARGRGGFIGQDGLNAPDSPTDVSGTSGDQQVSVAFTAPTDVGGSAITGYRVQDGTNAHGASGSSSPITVTGLTNGTSYTFNVWAINAFGYSAPSDASGSVTPAELSRALFAGDTSLINNVVYLAVATLGNAADFGDLTYVMYGGGMTGNSTTSVVGGGFTSGYAPTNTICSRVFATTGNYGDFGDLTNSVGNGMSSCSSSTRGIFAGGSDSGGTRTNVIQYITIASASNATDFGDLASARDNNQGGMSNGTRGICGYAGYGPPSLNSIEYITIASTGNASDFGDAQQTSFIYGASSNSTRGIAGRGTIIDYITIASTGNASDFGDLDPTRGDCTSASSSTRTVFTGSGTADTDYITIASLGNSSDFGTLPQKMQQSAALCQGHGGAS